MPSQARSANSDVGSSLARRRQKNSPHASTGYIMSAAHDESSALSRWKHEMQLHTYTHNDLCIRCWIVLSHPLEASSYRVPHRETPCIPDDPTEWFRRKKECDSCQGRLAETVRRTAAATRVVVADSNSTVSCVVLVLDTTMGSPFSQLPLWILRSMMLILPIHFARFTMNQPACFQLIFGG